MDYWAILDTILKGVDTGVGLYKDIKGTNSTATSTPAPINWDDVTKMLDLSREYNQYNRSGMFGSWDWTTDPDGTQRQVFTPRGEGGQAAADWMTQRLQGEGFDPYELSPSLLAFGDANLVDQMWNRGLFDETTVPDLRQTEYTPLGSMNRQSMFQPSDINFTTPPQSIGRSDGDGYDDEDYTDNIVESQSDRTGVTPGFSSGPKNGGPINEFQMRQRYNKTQPANQPYSGRQEILNSLGLNDLPRGTYEQLLDAEGNIDLAKYLKWAGRGASAVGAGGLGMGLGLLGQGLNYAGNQTLNNNVFMSDGSNGGIYDAWMGEGQSPQPIQSEFERNFLAQILNDPSLWGAQQSGIPNIRNVFSNGGGNRFSGGAGGWGGFGGSGGGYYTGTHIKSDH